MVVVIAGVGRESSGPNRWVGVIHKRPCVVQVPARRRPRQRQVPCRRTLAGGRPRGTVRAVRWSERTDPRSQGEDPARRGPPFPVDINGRTSAPPATSSPVGVQLPVAIDSPDRSLASERHDQRIEGGTTNRLIQSFPKEPSLSWRSAASGTSLVVPYIRFLGLYWNRAHRTFSRPAFTDLSGWPIVGAENAASLVSPQNSFGRRAQQ